LKRRRGRTNTRPSKAVVVAKKKDQNNVLILSFEEEEEEEEGEGMAAVGGGWRVYRDGGREGSWMRRGGKIARRKQGG